MKCKEYAEEEPCKAVPKFPPPKGIWQVVGNRSSCVRHLGLDVYFDKFNYQSMIRAFVKEMNTGNEE